MMFFPNNTKLCSKKPLKQPNRTLQINQLEIQVQKEEEEEKEA